MLPIHNFVTIACAFYLTFCSHLIKAEEALDLNFEGSAFKHIQFSDLDNESHLPHSWIASIEQDAQGFIWFATQGGLSRYDGITSKHFTFDPTSKGGLRNGFLWDIFEDSENRLWLAGHGGIHLYIPELEQFEFISESSTQIKIEGAAFLKIKESPNKNVWFASKSKGFTEFSSSSGKFIHHQELFGFNFENKHIVDFAFDQDGDLWVVFIDGQFIQFDFKSQSFSQVYSPNKSSNLLSTQVLAAMSNGQIWVGTRSEGLLVYDGNGALIDHIAPSTNNNCSTGIYAIAESKENNVWLGTKNGLCRSFVNDIQELTHFASTPKGINSIKIDNGGVIWLGTETGAHYWNSSLSYFDKITQESTPALVSGSSITSFASTPDSVLYLGSFGNGLTELDTATNRSVFYDDSSDISIGGNYVMSLLYDSNENLWVGTQYNGLFLRKHDSSEFKQRSNAGIEGSLNGNAISGIIELSNNQIAIATYGHGLSIYSPETDSFTQITNEDTSFIIDISEDQNGRVWLAVHHAGLFYYDIKTQEVVKYAPDNISTIAKDIHGVVTTSKAIWMTTNGYGVVKIELGALNEMPEYHIFNNSKGIASNSTYGGLEDNDGNIWISHSKGLSRIEPDTGKILNFNTTHGLQDSDFNLGAYYKAPNGRLFFGGPNGFNTFMPKDIPVNTYQPPLRLVGFSHANTPMPIQHMLREDGVLELNYKDTLVDFEFAALDYTKPSGNQYRYMLKGYKDVWSNQGNNNHISVPYLSPGDYSLVVQGSNNEGIWSEPLEIEIEVLPPIYQTWYAYMAYGLIALLGLLSILRQQQIKHQRQLSHERRLHQLAYYDSLTGLPNRQSFYENLEKFISLAKRGNYQAGVMFIDLDRFKRINDTLGHHYGDKVLQEVAIRLKESVRESDFIARNYHIDTFNNNELARLGGDEFTLFLSQIESPEETSAVTQRIIESLSKPIIIDNYELTVTPSIGIAMYPENGSTVHELMKHADIAMYQAKEDGRRTFKFYSSNLNTRALERLQLEEQMRNALKNNEFQLYYQPQVDLQSNKITKAEALIRWIHPELGFVSPADFIPIAEESGLIIELGDWILETACSQAKAWQTQGLSGCRVSINVSSVQFKQTALIDKVQEALEKTGLPPHLLELEITESAVMSDVEDNIERLQQFKKMGISVAVDDFGTGYSSLSYLKLFPIDTLKIDRSFVDDIATDENDVAIVKAIMVLAEAMDLKVVAEGIETMEQLKILHTFGCQQIQGYFFSRPLPVDQFRQFVTHDFHQDKAMWKLDMVG